MVKKTLLSRREFISILAASTAVYSAPSFAINRNKNYKEPWLTLAEVQQHLFPAEEDSSSSISANDIQALEYLRSSMEIPGFDKEEKLLIHNGVDWLNDLSKQEYDKKFIQLNSDAKEKILRRIEKSDVGERWLSTLLSYLLEALLTDPIYGGNPNGIGWTWLQHQAGFPRPPENKKYFMLNKISYRNIQSQYRNTPSRYRNAQSRYRNTKA